MKIALLSANLGNFDKPIDPVPQKTEHEVVFHRFTDDNFPPIVGLTPRLQYRIPKLFGWEMFPGYDYYIWFDGSCTLKRDDCVEWYLSQIGDSDVAFFKHMDRKTIWEEVKYVDNKLQQNHPYIVKRYGGGLHKEQYEIIKNDKNYKDDKLYTSTAFIYKNTKKVRSAMKMWWYYQSRYYTVDQIVQPYVFWKSGVDVKMINEHQYKIGYLSLIYHHS